MAVEQSAGREEEQVAALLVATAGTLLESQGTGAPKAFVDALFGLTVPEDVVRYDAREVAALAEAAWGFLAERKPGASKIRLEVPAAAGERLRSISVLEVVNDDMPFLVDSITMEVNRQGLTLHLIVHPVMKIRRDAEHRLTGLARHRDEAEGRFESLIHVEVDRRTDPKRLAELHDGLLGILADVRAAVGDWEPMRQAVIDAAAQLRLNAPAVPADDLAEDLAFIEWLANGNFTLLGQRDYDLVSDGGEDTLRVAGAGLGILLIFSGLAVLSITK